MEKTHMYW